MIRKAEKLLISKIYNNLNQHLWRSAVACAIFAFALVFTHSANAATFTVSTAADSGTGSLREAINSANTTAGADTITFSGALSIKPLSSLPTITEQVTIDGYTGVSGATQNTGATGTGFNGTLVVELDGSLAGDSAIGLRISASNCTVQGLVINRFSDSGIRIDTGTGNKIYGNFIGTDTTGTAALGNFNRGILIVGSTGNQIGSTTVGSSNVISGNFGTGISITGGGSANVRRNFIGTDKSGTADLGNSQDGVRIVDSSGSTIGGANSTSRNIISGNEGSGVSIIQSSNTTSATSNVISANFIGVDVTGDTAALSGGFSTSPVGNSGSGVLINAAGNTVGGGRTTSTSSSTCVNACNVISGNRANGVSISSNFATGNTVSGNNIGVGLGNTTAIGNRDNGVQISNLASGNTTGGTTSAAGFCNNTCNIIANNGDTASSSARAGIYVDSTAATANAIRANSIYNNGNPPNGSPANGLGIDLGAIGTTANDSKDPDVGANDLQNSPVLSSAFTNGNVGGTLNSTPNTTFAIDYFRNATPDTSVTSEARTYIGSSSITTDSNGNAIFSFTSSVTLAAGQFITATATSTGGTGAQAVGDTSEISNVQTVTANTGGVTGLEADVAARPNGDGAIQSNDVVQMLRFLNELDTPSTIPNEFQRADSAPRRASGDPSGDGNGVIDSADVVQTLRYLNELDTTRPASGPTGAATPSPTGPTLVSKVGGKNLGKTVTQQKEAAPSAPAAAPALRVENATGSAGNQVTVNIRVDAVGNESQYGFALLFDPNVLTFTNFAAGSTGASSFSCNTTATNGRVRCSIGGFPNNQTGTNPTITEINAGDNQILIKVIFTISASAAPGTVTTINIGSQSASDENTNSITPAVQSGTVTVAGPTAATTTIGGRILSATGSGLANATVSLLDAKTGQIITTVSNDEGYYSFSNIEVGKDYIISPTVKGYSFSPASKYFSLIDGLTDVDFKALRKSKVRFNN